MENPSELANFFNDISLCGLEGLAQKKLDDISSTLELLEVCFVLLLNIYGYDLLDGANYFVSTNFH